MPRVGLLGLEPFVVSQVEKLDRNLDVVVLDAVDDDARGDLTLDVVVLNREHAGAPQFLSTHPDPPVVVIEEGLSPDDQRVPGAPIRLGRPISSPELLEAIDRSRGISPLRRSLRAITIEQDDVAVPDRWAAIGRTAVALGVLAGGAWQFATWGLAPLVLLTAWAIGRALWWRLAPRLIAVDAAVVLALIVLLLDPVGGVDIVMTLLAASVALEAGFALGLWRAVAGCLVGMALVVTVWLAGFDGATEQVMGTGISSLLVVTAAGTGAMARRLWQDQTQSRSSELRRFRSALYELSRRQAVVAVSFDVGTVAEDALARLIADVQPHAAMVLVADGAGPLQVGASHNLVTPPPVRLTWQPGMADDPPEGDDSPPPSGAAPSAGRDADRPDHPGEARAADGVGPPPSGTASGFGHPASAAPPAPPVPTDGPSGSLVARMEAARRRRERASNGAFADRQLGTSRFDGQPAAMEPDPDPGRDPAPPLDAAEREQRVGGRRRARAPERRMLGDLLDRTTIEAVHRARLADILEQLATSLPDSGEVLVHGAELDGELMGALVVVSPTDPRPLGQHAEETALALDSVRLFNRLRAFTRDQERARIGRSLHDGVMQTLAHVAFELDRVSNDSWDDSQVETLGRLRDHVLGTVDEMRAVVNDLRTVRLDRGLPAALEAMALTLSPAGGPVIEVTASDVGNLPGDVEEQFLRIAEEALTNAVRHSGARTVTLDLHRRDGSLLLQVSDDGFGFTQSRVGERDGGVGLTSMYQRAKAVGAGLDIDTGANGTIITVHRALVRPGSTSSPPPPAPPPPGRRRRR